MSDVVLGGLSFNRFIEISGQAVKASFGYQKERTLLSVDNGYFPSTVPALSISSLEEYISVFGKDDNYNFVNRFFGYVSESGEAVQKLLVARWYRKDDAPPFIASGTIDKIANIKALGSGNLTVEFTGETCSINLDVSSVNSYSELALLIQAQLNSDQQASDMFKSSRVSYNAIDNNIVITGGVGGVNQTADLIRSENNDFANALGIGTDANIVYSNGANSETYQEFISRMIESNVGVNCFSTNMYVDEESMVDAINYVQSKRDVARLQIVYKNIATLEAFYNDYLKDKDLSAYSLIYDPLDENVNALDSARQSSTNLNKINGSVSFNCNAVGYKEVTTLNKVSDIQGGNSNTALANRLDRVNANYVYSIGIGNQKKVRYGLGKQDGFFGTQANQVNQIGLNEAMQVSVANYLVAFDKIPLLGDGVGSIVDSALSPVFAKYQENGVIAKMYINDGGLSNLEKTAVINTFGNDKAIDLLNSQGYYYQLMPADDTDKQLKQRRVYYAYVASGELLKLVIHYLAIGF
jgi:hypothetical protein